MFTSFVAEISEFGMFVEDIECCLAFDANIELKILYFFFAFLDDSL